VKKRIILLGVLGLAASVNGAVVTYTLTLHESTSCQVTANNNFTVWVTVSQADNSGLFAYGVDLTGTGDPGGPTTMTLVNRTPNGSFDADPSDPNYDPSQVYSTKFFGFGAGRATSGSSGVVSGVQDLAKGTDLIPLFGYGQSPGNANNLKPPPDTSTGAPVQYKTPPTISTGSDIVWPPCTPGYLPAGSARLLTGTWTGNAPSIHAASVNTKASVWKLSHPNNTENELATLQIQNHIIDFPPDTVSLSATAQNPNQAVGGAIAVSGANGSYVSEVDQLLDPSVNKGSAPIQGIGDESGNIYVMARLSGTAADIAAVLGNTTQDVDASDAEYSPLHVAYDTAFGNGGFNALFKFPNIAGGKSFNWDFTFGHPNVTVDQLAAVPEPAGASLLLAPLLGLLRRRRARV